MTLTQLYFLTVVLPNSASVISGLSVFFYIVAGGLIFCYFPVSDIVGKDEGIKVLAWGKRFLISAIIASLTTIILPSQQQLYFLAGGYVATNTKDVAKLPDNVVKAANAWLEKAAALADDKTPTK